MTARQARYLRSKLVPFRRVGDDILFAAPGRDDVQLLTGPAATAWTLLASPTTARSLTVALGRAYRKPASEIRDEVERMLDSLVAAGGVEQESGRG